MWTKQRQSKKLKKNTENRGKRSEGRSELRAKQRQTKTAEKSSSLITIHTQRLRKKIEKTTPNTEKGSEGSTELNELKAKHKQTKVEKSS